MFFTSQSLSFPICKMEIIRMRGDNMYVWGGGSWSCASHLTCTKLLISFPLDVFSQFLVIFLGGRGCKESTCNAKDLGSIPGFGRSPGERHGYTLQYSCLENPRDRGYSPWGHKEVDTAEQKTLPLPLPRLDFEIPRQRSF